VLAECIVFVAACWVGAAPLPMIRPRTQLWALRARESEESFWELVLEFPVRMTMGRTCLDMAELQRNPKRHRRRAGFFSTVAAVFEGIAVERDVVGDGAAVDVRRRVVLRTAARGA